MTSTTDLHQRNIGEANLSNMRDLIRSVALYPVTHRRLRTIDQFQRLVDAASAELGNLEAKPYIRLYSFVLPWMLPSLLTSVAVIQASV